VQKNARPLVIAYSIVFVHGLTGGHETTWTYKSQILWPKHLLPQDVSTARIFTWGYDADVIRFSFTAAGSNTLLDHGKNLATDLGSERRRTSTPARRPIIFVAHSLGGLVVEQLRQRLCLKFL
jgi:pimeloyl-ACP methyl ester carboxylesterase